MLDRDARQRLQDIAAQLATTGNSPRTSIRTLLAWFDFQRRGEWVIATVRRELRAVGLRTSPDFADLGVGFDSFVEFVFDSSGNDRPATPAVRDESSDQNEAPPETPEPDLGTAPDDGEELEGLDRQSAPLGDYPLDDLLIRSETRTVHGVCRRIEQGFYVMDPDFQRDFIWKDDKQSRLIESVAMRIPLPVFYLAEDEEGRMIVVDGLQRLSTFERFLADDLKLRLADRPDLHGKRFSELGAKLQNRIEDCNLTFFIMDARVPDRARLDIFERVNGGEPLSRQQMRNCLYMGKATRFLKNEAHTDVFLRATGRSLRSDTMRDREFLNRFCAFQILGVKQYHGDMDRFLGDCLRTMNGMEDDELVFLRDDLRRTLQSNYDVFGKHAFRKQRPGVTRRSVINASLWDVMSTGLARYDRRRVLENTSSLQDAFLGLLAYEDFNTAITYATNDDKRVRARFEMTRSMLQEVLGDHSA